jgi:hypothetical protein
VPFKENGTCFFNDLLIKDDLNMETTFVEFPILSSKPPNNKVMFNIAHISFFEPHKDNKDLTVLYVNSIQHIVNLPYLKVKNRLNNCSTCVLMEEPVEEKHEPNSFYSSNPG